MGGANGRFPDGDQAFEVCGECGFYFHGGIMFGKPNYFKPRFAVCSPLTLTLSLREREPIVLNPHLHHRIHPVLRHHHGDVFHRHARRDVDILQLL